jgi:hypothetical protein
VPPKSSGGLEWLMVALVTLVCGGRHDAPFDARRVLTEMAEIVKFRVFHRFSKINQKIVL